MCSSALFFSDGMPTTIVSDNGPYYNAKEIKQAMDNMGMHHMNSSPHCHHSNGLEENYIQLMKSLLFKAKKIGENPIFL